MGADTKFLPLRFYRGVSFYACMPGNKCITLPWEFKSVPLRMQGNGSLDNPANLLFYVRETKYRSRIRGLNPKSVKVMCFVDQQSQCVVWISLVESFEADSGNISDEVRELVREVLAFFSNRFCLNVDNYDLLGHAASQRFLMSNSRSA